MQQQSIQKTRFIERLLSKAISDLVPLPEAVTRVLVEAQNSEVTAHQLEEIIGTDQALTAKVLRVVNSAYYGLPNPVSSLGYGCVMLGVSQIRNLTLSMSVMGQAEARTEHQRDIQQMLWRHAFGAAATARYIAKHKGLGPAAEELAFVGGLLHDIGRQFLWANLGDTYEVVVRDARTAGVPIGQMEKNMLGTTHCQVGGTLARRWNFPDQLTNVIEGHDGPFEVDSPKVLLAVHLADRLNEGVYTGEDSFDVEACDPAALDWLGATDEAWDDVRVFAAEKIEAAAASFAAVAA